MKKYMLAGAVWMCLLCAKVYSMNEAIPYTIYMASDRDDLYEVKEDVLTTYRDLMRGVNDESDGMMIIHNLKEFEFDEDTTAAFKDNTLQIVVGDGEGAFISGELKRDLFCIPEVKPKSLIQEYFMK